MKKAVVRVLVALCLLTLFALGVDWVFATSELAQTLFVGEAFDWPGLRQLDSATLVTMVGAAAVLLPILAAASWILVGRDESIMATTADGDEIRLQPRAIERVVNREVRANVVEVIRVASFARQAKRGVPGIRVAVVVSDRQPAPKIEKEVRDETVRVLKHLLGVGDTSGVRVVVENITGAGAGSSRRTEARKPRKRKPAGKTAAKAPANTE